MLRRILPRILQTDFMDRFYGQILSSDLWTDFMDGFCGQILQTGFTDEFPPSFPTNLARTKLLRSVLTIAVNGVSQKSDAHRSQ